MTRTRALRLATRLAMVCCLLLGARRSLASSDRPGSPEALAKEVSWHTDYHKARQEAREKTPPEQEAAWEAKYNAGPTGFLVYHPAGGDPLSPVKLLTQFLGNLLAASIAAFIISLVFASYGQRVLVITLLGVIVSVVTRQSPVAQPQPTAA